MQVFWYVLRYIVSVIGGKVYFNGYNLLFSILFPTFTHLKTVLKQIII